MLDAQQEIKPILLAVEFEQNKYQLELAEDVNASVVTNSTLEVHYQTELWHSGNVCSSQSSWNNVRF